jgi:membrane protein DedA with SNARE-associated domain
VNELAESLAGSSAAQGVVILFSSTIFQDPATIAAGLLVATHRMAFPCALAALMAGITLGDLALYAAGRLAGPAVRRRWIPPERLDRAIRWFRRYGAAAVLAGRVLPGCRYPTFVAAGVLRAPFLTFLAAALCSSFVWTLLLLVGAILLGDTFRLLLDRMAWLVIASVVVVAVQLTLVRRRARRSLRQELDGIDVDELAPHVGASQVAADACHDPDAKALLSESDGEIEGVVATAVVSQDREKAPLQVYEAHRAVEHNGRAHRGPVAPDDLEDLDQPPPLRAALHIPRVETDPKAVDRELRGQVRGLVGLAVIPDQAKEAAFLFQEDNGALKDQAG